MKEKSLLILGILTGIILLFYTYGFPELIHAPPQSLHFWRQTDCLSFAANYKTGSSFLEPTIHNLGTSETGRATAEFPIISYLAAKLSALTGDLNSTYRWICFGAFILGLIASFLLIRMATGLNWLSFGGALLLFTSPTLAFYSFNFLSDIPALAMALCGLTAGVAYLKYHRNHFLVLAIILYSLAGLLKASAMLTYPGLMLAVIYTHYKNHGRHFSLSNFFASSGIFLLPLLLQLAWYSYASKYNQDNRADYFLIGTLGIWKYNSSEILETLLTVREHFKWSYFRPETSVILTIALAATLWKIKQLQVEFRIIILTSILGLVAFCLLFFGALRDHDYYVINLFVIVPLILVGLGQTNLLTVRPNRIWLPSLVTFAILVHSADFARRRISGRYNPEGWENHPHVTHVSHYVEFGRQLNDYIPVNQSVISLSDPTPNGTLYLLDRKGWSNFNLRNDPEKLEALISKHNPVLVFHERNEATEQSLKHFQTDTLLQYHGIFAVSVSKKY